MRFMGTWYDSGMNWKDRIITKPVQGPDELRLPHPPPPQLDLTGPDHGKAPRRETLGFLVEKGVITPNEARKNWNGPR